jgi:hypothetical protein
MTIPPRYRGAFDQRLQTRGGERWPGHDLASEMRCKGPAVQAALVPACPPGTPRACDGRQAVLPSQERCLKCLGLVTVGCHAEVSPSRGRNDYRGGRGANLKHRARDALGLADLRHALPIARTRVKGEAHRTSTSLDVARRRGPAGPFGPLASRAPSVLFPGDADFPKCRRIPAPDQKSGRRSVGLSAVAFGEGGLFDM